MEVRYEAASPDASTHEMQIARDKDEIWITVSKSGILPRCASTMGNVEVRRGQRGGVCERNVARSHLCIRADLDDTGGGSSASLHERMREKE